MRVGYGEVELDVPLGATMGGYMHRLGGVAGHLDPLTVAAITWHDDQRRIALVIADVVCVNRDLTAATRAATPDADLLILTATHTHAGPETGCLPGGGATPQPWRDRLCSAAARAVSRAVATERPAEGILYRSELTGVGAQRSLLAPEPVVPLDLIAVRDTANHLDGVLVVLPVHPTVLPQTNRLVSADLPGAVRRRLRDRVGGVRWVSVATGAAGDISTRHTRNGHGPAELDRLASLVTDQCVAMLTGNVDGSQKEPVWHASDALAWRIRELQLAWRELPPAIGSPVANAMAAFHEAHAAGDPLRSRIAEARLQGARLLAGLAPRDGAGDGGAPLSTSGVTPIPAEVAAVRIGRLGIAAMPGEPFLSAAARIQTAATTPTVTLGYANGYPGYLPPASAYADDSYEALAAVVRPGSAERLADTAARLLAGNGAPGLENGQ